MNKAEFRATTSLATIFAFRMLGLFMILPIFSAYANHYGHVTPALIGLALGVYGLTQSIFQIPMGVLSDKIGRKPIIAIGLGIFAFGSMLAAMSTSIHGVIVGRAMQGAGAVGSTLIALLADLTSEDNRTHAMAVIGMTVGLTFSIALLLGPIIAQWLQLPGIFWLTTIFALLGLIVLYWWVPQPKKERFHRDAEPVPTLFKDVLRDKELLRLNFGIFASHVILTASFVALPIILLQDHHLVAGRQWIIYLPVLLLAFFAMFPMIIYGEKHHKMKEMLLVSICMIFIAHILLWQIHHSLVGIGIALFIFFTAFSFCEASLPSLISKEAPVAAKGTAMGVYSTCQFFGIFIGGTIGGLLYAHFDIRIIFIFCAFIALIWGFFSQSMKQPKYLSNVVLELKQRDKSAEELKNKLLLTQGVSEAEVDSDAGYIYLKVDKKIFDATTINFI